MINYLKNNILYLLIVLIALVSFWGGLIYRIYLFNFLGISISIALSLVSFIIILFYHYKNNVSGVDVRSKYSTRNREQGTRNKKILFILYPLFFTLYISCFYILFQSQTTASITSPWSVIPSYFFVIFFLTLLTNLSILLITKRKNLFLLSTFYFLLTSIALIIYKIGYGFDPFIHQAAMDVIAEKGVIYPKPFYYLGQYALLIITYKITFIPLLYLNKILIPLLAAITLPWTFSKFLNKYFEDKQINSITVLALLVLPFSIFIVTTPQNLAFLFLIIAIFLGLTCSSLIDLIVIYLLAIATLITHPIAGIPAIFFALAITIHHNEKIKSKKYLYSLIFILSAISLPTAFAIFNPGSFQGLSIHSLFSNFLNIFSWFKINIPHTENFILNFVYLYIFNIKTIIALLILGGIYLACKNKEKCQLFFINLLISISLFVAYLFTLELNFDYLINYEQADFANRIIIVSIIFLLPFIITSIYWLINRILKQKRSIQIPLFIFLAIIITTSLYNSYPRADRYYNSHGYSVSQNDIDAVHWIEDNTDNNYIVLANQQVSAAATHEFGFNKYYQDDIYFYPVPTSGPLYQYYLNMVYEKANKATMLEAMNLAGVNEAYFVLNKYWWAFSKILDEAKLEADSWQKIGDGEIYIFKYNK